jgi:hypothetical protein
MPYISAVHYVLISASRRPLGLDVLKSRCIGGHIHNYSHFLSLDKFGPSRMKGECDLPNANL